MDAAGAAKNVVESAAAGGILPPKWRTIRVRVAPFKYSNFYISPEGRRFSSLQQVEDHLAAVATITAQIAASERRGLTVEAR